MARSTTSTTTTRPSAMRDRRATAVHPMLALHALIRLHSPAILCLHSVGPGPDAMPSFTFRSLLDGLLERRYQFLTADDAIGPRVLRRRSVLLTFDDGRRDNF